MTTNTLDRIAAEQKRHHYRTQPPSTAAQRSSLKKRTEAELSATIPSEYLSFLEKSNGLDWNGVTIFATETIAIEGFSDRFIEGFVDANLGYRDYAPFAKYLVFGESDMDFYALEISSQRYVILEKVSLDTMNTASSFEQLLDKAFEGRV